MRALESILQCPQALEVADDKTFDPLLPCKAFRALKNGKPITAFELAKASLEQHPIEGVSYMGLPVGIVAAQRLGKANITALWLARFSLVLKWDSDGDICDPNDDFALKKGASSLLADKDADHVIGKMLCSASASAVGRLIETEEGGARLSSLKELQHWLSSRE